MCESELLTLTESSDQASPASEEALMTRLLTLLKHQKDDPLEGLAGYLVTEDPTYLPDCAEIKALIRRIGRDRLLRLLLTLALHHPSLTEEV